MNISSSTNAIPTADEMVLGHPAADRTAADPPHDRERRRDRRRAGRSGRSSESSASERSRSPSTQKNTSGRPGRALRSTLSTMPMGSGFYTSLCLPRRDGSARYSISFVITPVRRTQFHAAVGKASSASCGRGRAGPSLDNLSVAANRDQVIGRPGSARTSGGTSSACVTGTPFTLPLTGVLLLMASGALGRGRLGPRVWSPARSSEKPRR